jgi:hypothetical protein
VQQVLHDYPQFGGVQASVTDCHPIEGCKVTLEGEVHTEQGKRHAEALVANIDGVRRNDVIDKIAITVSPLPLSGQSKPEIKARVESALRQAGLCNVTVSVFRANSGFTCTLHGNVISDEEKQRAPRICAEQGCPVDYNFIFVQLQSWFSTASSSCAHN